MLKYNGVFVVDKPASIGSTQIVERLKWTLINAAGGKKKGDRNPLKIGHGGALDPFATGVLAIGVGKGTKDLGDMTHSTDKEYVATVFMGHETTTCDREGHVVLSRDSSHITAGAIEQTLAQFRGDNIKQFPPVYSSVSVDGIRLWDYARNGIKVPYIPSRECRVSKLELVSPVIQKHQYKPLGVANEEEMAVAAGVAQIKKEGGDMTREEYEKSKEGKPTVSKKQLKRQKKDGKRKYNAEEVAAVVRDPVPEVEATQTHEKSSEEREKEYLESLKSSEGSEGVKFALEQAEGGVFSPKTPIFQIRAAVSSGTYIRQLANDICESLGVCGHLVELRRLTQGDFGIENCFPLEVIVNKPEQEWEGELQRALKEGKGFKYVGEKKIEVSEAEKEADTTEAPVVEQKTAETVSETPSNEIEANEAPVAEAETLATEAETPVVKKQKTDETDDK